MKEKIINRIVSPDTDLLEALKIMDKTDKKLLFVFDENTFLNILSAGDIQRAILNNFPFDTKIINVLRKETLVASDKDNFEDIKKLMRSKNLECMPVVNAIGELVEVYFWEEIFRKDELREEVKFNLPVVIMAGGKGTRMRPITNVIPKPLIPLGNKTILEIIMDSFNNVGCKSFYLSVNYKADVIKYYMDQIENSDYDINYFKETQPLGTAGSLYLIKDKIKTTFFVSNCDILIDQDYSEILKYHQENKNELTIVSALKHYPIPYGTIETKNNGVLDALKEKPELTYQINTGMYILEPHLLSQIPENKFFHITHLIDDIMLRGGRVGVFPVSEGSWKDIGTWDEYLKNQALVK